MAQDERVIEIKVKSEHPWEIARQLEAKIPRVFLFDRINNTSRVLMGVLWGQLCVALGNQLGGLSAETTLKILIAMTMVLTLGSWMLRQAAAKARPSSGGSGDAES